MNAHEIQEISQFFDPLFAIALIGCAIWQLKKAAVVWIVCVAVAVGVAQQISKIVQHTAVLGKDFPSTHFAVSLAIAGGFWALNRKFIPATLVYLVVYAALIVWQQYHAPIELVGSVYALPLGYFAGRFGTRTQKIASN